MYNEEGGVWWIGYGALAVYPELPLPGFVTWVVYVSYQKLNQAIVGDERYYIAIAHTMAEVIAKTAVPEVPPAVKEDDRDKGIARIKKEYDDRFNSS